MKAIRIHELGPPEVMQPEEVKPPIPAAGQILIDVKAIGVNPVDTYIRAGWYGTRSLPYTPGVDAAGIVRQVGAGVKHIRTGQRVFSSGTISGAYAEQTLCKAPQVHPLPERIGFAQGAALGVPYGTAYRALFQRACAAAGQTVLIHGASGGVGIAAIQLAKAAGLKIIATAGTENGRRLVLEQGADLALDHHNPKHFDEALNFTQGRGIDILVEMLANVNLGHDLPVMAAKGQVVIVGSRGSVQIDPRDIMSREISIFGVMSRLETEAEHTEAWGAIILALEEGKLNPIIALELPLNDAPKAHHEIMESSHCGKIVLIP